MPAKLERACQLFGFARPKSIFAYADGAVKTHDRIRLANPDLGKKTDLRRRRTRKSSRPPSAACIFSEIWPPELGFPNKAVRQEASSATSSGAATRSAATTRPSITLDKLKELGFREATKAGVSIGIDDMIIPKEKETGNRRTPTSRSSEVEKQYRKGVITAGERYNKIIDIWTHAPTRSRTSCSAPSSTTRARKEFNPVFLMVDSGARGNRQQVRQLAGMRGLMAKPSGEIIEKPILSNFREGLTVLEYFISTHGARKGLADTALKTADSGYMTRKLVDVAQDVIIREEDCGTTNGIWVQADLRRRRRSRQARRAPRRPRSLRRHRESARTRRKCSSRPTRRSTKSTAKAIDEARRRAASRSARVLTCESKHGVCANCYGRNLATGALVKLGEAVGIIAAQSIGEPGTQLTMRTFHIGGTASQALQAAADQGEVRRHDPLQRPAHRASSTTATNIVLNKNGSISIHRRRRPRTRALQHRHRLGHLRARTAARSRRATPSCNGIRTTFRFSPRRPARSNSTTSSKASR